MERNRRVLVIDDDESLRNLVRHTLSSLPDVGVLMAASGADGIAMMQEYKPALVILDLDMPEMRGDEVLRHCKQNLSLRTIPIVVLTSMAPSDNLLAKTLLAGATDYLVKPFNADVLRQYVSARMTLAERTAHMRYDIANPLSAVVGYAQLLCEDDVAQSPAEVKQLASELLAAGNKLFDLFARFVAQAP